ncbi:MAG TPA: RNA polymerase sigma-70 factor [Acidimicrobiales bacterium]|nr:RNA polymerase sigma-70 factor [Acidimicrobiales bacterium]
MANDQLHEDLRPLLFSIAYRMVGSVSEAEDVVQEAYLRLRRATDAGTRIESPKAYLASITTRLAIDHLRSARVRRESYVGPWLPEPLVVEPGPEDLVEVADSLSTAFLVLLETLSPVERAVFLLHEVFGYGYDEVAEIVGRTEDNCRQILSRARRHIEARRPRFTPSPDERDALARQFLLASEAGDVDGLVRLLADDVAFYSDGGSRAAAALRPVRGRQPVGRLLGGLLARVRELGLRFRPALVNGQPGALVLDPEDKVFGVYALDIVDGTVATIWSVVNPEKLRHLGPVSDLGRQGQA